MLPTENAGDEHCTLEPRRLLVITGRPGDGKSEFTDELVLRLCPVSYTHLWKHTAEEYVKIYHSIHQ